MYYIYFLLKQFKFLKQNIIIICLIHKTHYFFHRNLRVNPIKTKKINDSHFQSQKTSTILNFSSWKLKPHSTFNIYMISKKMYNNLRPIQREKNEIIQSHAMFCYKNWKLPDRKRQTDWEKKNRYPHHHHPTPSNLVIIYFFFFTNSR